MTELAFQIEGFRAKYGARRGQSFFVSFAEIEGAVMAALGRGLPLGSVLDALKAGGVLCCQRDYFAAFALPEINFCMVPPLLLDADNPLSPFQARILAAEWAARHHANPIHHARRRLLRALAADHLLGGSARRGYLGISATGLDLARHERVTLTFPHCRRIRYFVTIDALAIPRGDFLPADILLSRRCPHRATLRALERLAAALHLRTRLSRDFAATLTGTPFSAHPELEPYALIRRPRHAAHP